LLSSAGNFLASRTFTTFVIVFIIVFAVLTILAEALLQYDYEWLIIPISIIVAGVAAYVKRRRGD
jgi:hypothetical protein